MVVVVFPSPYFVGVIAVTKMSFPFLFSGFISDYTHEYSTIWQILAAGIFAVSILLLILSGKILKKKDKSDAEIITKMN